MMDDEITDLQAIVLGWFLDHGAGRAEEIADALELPVVVVDAILADLTSTGLILPAPLH